MVLLNENWQVVESTTRSPGAARVTYELQARINPQYHSVELNRDYVEIQVTYSMNVGYIYSGTWNFSATGCSDVAGGGTLNGSGTLISGGFWAYHDNNGNYSTSVYANLSFYFSAANAYLSGVIELPNIPRSSGAAWKDNKNHVKLDGKDTLKLILDKKVDKYRHSLVWVVGGSGPKWLNTNDIDTEYVFRPTEEMIKYATDTKSVYGYLGVGTYSSGASDATMIGTTTIGFFIDLPEEKYSPVINSATVKEIGNSKVPEDKVFRYLSKKKLSMQAEVRGFATVKNVYVMHNKQQYPLSLSDGLYSVDLEGMTDGDILFVIEDSRGFKTVRNWRGTFVPYFYPTLTEFSAERDNPTVNDGYASAKGTYYNGESNQLTITLKDEQGHSVNCAYTPNGNNFEVKQRVSGYRYDQNYQLTLVLTDSYGQSNERSYVLTGNLWAMILGKLTTSVHMLWVRRNGNNPCGIYNEGDMTTEGTTYARGKLILGKDNDFMITKTFTTNVVGLQGNQAAYAYVPYAIPEGYALVDFYDACTTAWHGCTIRANDESRKTVIIYVQNLSNSEVTPAATVYLKGLFVRKESK
jgi:hypothetical protein|nr:MAG TPA: protein of unknown function DUF859 [Caudoviricetes sp.]